MSKPNRPTRKQPPCIDSNESEQAWPSQRHLPAQASAEPILCGTLCLLTLNVLSHATANNGTPVMNAFVCRKIASNLRQLSSHPGFSSDFKRICDRLLRRWQDEFEDTDPGVDSDAYGLGPMTASSTRH